MTTDRVLYGIKQVRIKNLLTDGAVDPSASNIDIDCPVSAGYSFIYVDGEQATLRGGDDIISIIENDDKFIGVDIALAIAELIPEVDEAICGGVATSGSSKWESPKSTAEEAYPFEMYIWVANYEESDSNSPQDGFIKFTLPMCKGRRTNLDLADKTFAGHGYAVECRKNSSDPSSIKSAITYEKVTSIV